MELRHLRFFALVRQSTGNRRLDIWWRRNESLFLLPCQGKCLKKTKTISLFVCLVLKYCEYDVLTHSPSGVFCLVEKVFWGWQKRSIGFIFSGKDFSKTPTTERCLFEFFSRSYVGLILRIFFWPFQVNNTHCGCGLKDLLPAQFKCQRYLGQCSHMGGYR